MSNLLTEGVVHWTSLVTERPICGAVGDQPATNDRDEVTCLVCIAQLRRAKKRVQRVG